MKIKHNKKHICQSENKLWYWKDYYADGRYITTELERRKERKWFKYVNNYHGYNARCFSWRVDYFDKRNSKVWSLSIYDAKGVECLHAGTCIRPTTKSKLKERIRKYPKLIKLLKEHKNE